jgi:hypothetical protein
MTCSCDRRARRNHTSSTRSSLRGIQPGLKTAAVVGVLGVYGKGLDANLAHQSLAFVEYNKVARRNLGVCLGILVVDLGVEYVAYNWGSFLQQIRLGKGIHHTCV